MDDDTLLPRDLDLLNDPKRRREFLEVLSRRIKDDPSASYQLAEAARELPEPPTREFLDRAIVFANWKLREPDKSAIERHVLGRLFGRLYNVQKILAEPGRWATTEVIELSRYFVALSTWPPEALERVERWQFEAHQLREHHERIRDAARHKGTPSSIRQLVEELPYPMDARVMRGGVIRLVVEWRSLRELFRNEPTRGRPRTDVLGLYTDYVDLRGGYREEFGDPPEPIATPVDHDRALEVIAKLYSTPTSAAKRLWEARAALVNRLERLRTEAPEDPRILDLEDLVACWANLAVPTLF